MKSITFISANLIADAIRGSGDLGEFYGPFVVIGICLIMIGCLVLDSIPLIKSI